MSWNYRVVEHTEEFAIHEVYYDSARNPIAITENPAYLAAESVHELTNVLDLIEQAFWRPVLHLDDLPS